MFVMCCDGLKKINKFVSCCVVCCSQPRFTCARFDYESAVQVFRLRTCMFACNSLTENKMFITILFGHIPINLARPIKYSNNYVNLCMKFKKMDSVVPLPTGPLELFSILKYPYLAYRMTVFMQRRSSGSACSAYDAVMP